MMRRSLRFLLLLVWLEMGLLLILLPWSIFWEANYFLNRFPILIPLLQNSYLRGAVSGLGVLNALFAIEAFRRSSPVASRT
jgi:hypothetical protein